MRRKEKKREKKCYFFFFNDTATTEIYTLSLHDALPISIAVILSVSIGIENAMTYSEIRPFQLPKNVIIDMVLILLCSNLIGSYITNKWISYILVPLGFFALIVSFTRKLWIVLVLVVLLFLLFFVYQTLKKRQISSKDSKMFFLLFFSSVLLVCLLIYSLPNLSDFIMRRFTETKGLNDPSIQNRWIFIIEPLRYARSIHFIGTGLGFDVLFFNPDRLQVLLSKGAEWGTYMENGYVYFILKTGILGLTIFLWMMIRALRTSLYLFQGSKDRFLKGISLWLFFYLIVITISSNFDQSFNNFMAAPPIAVHFSLIEYLRQRVKASVG